MRISCWASARRMKAVSRIRRALFSSLFGTLCASPEIVEGFLCRFRLGVGFPDFVVDGREPVGGAVPALVVVERVTPVDDHSLRLNGITESIAGQHFPFQRREERFGGSIVETRPDPSHRLPNSQLAAQLGESVCGIGATAVGVEYDPLGLLVAPDRLAATAGYRGPAPSPNRASAQTRSGSRSCHRPISGSARPR